MGGNPEIAFDKRKADELRRLYAHAVDTKKESFMFHGHELLTSYAKYLIEFLTMKGL